MLSIRLGRFDEGEHAYRRALELNPNFALAHAIIGLPLAQQEMNDEAVSGAEHALRLSPNDRLVGTYALLAMAMAHFSAGNYAECTAWARKMIEKNPEDPRGYYFLAGALAMQGEMNTATEARNTLLRLRPGFSLAWMTENMPNAGAITERLRDGLRKAGVPEK